MHTTNDAVTTVVDAPDSWQVGPYTFSSRLLVGTGRYASITQARRAIDESGAEMVTVALRRVDLTANAPSVLDAIDLDRHTLLPNTAGCYTAEDAVRTAHLAREAGMGDLLKLEVIGCPKTLYPDNEETLRAAKMLSEQGFVVMAYCGDDVVVCRRLEDAGVAAVMPLAAPIGSGLGIRNPHNLRLILEEVSLPVVVDAGVGTASDAAVALELGCSAVLMNSAIAGANDPIAMARAMRLAVAGGRLAALAGRMPRKLYATASSPLDGLIA
ncbi:MAG: thiazole synthase [Myxococcales bacterium]|nr:thiazole synthase [Myxococcales bacterium]